MSNSYSLYFVYYISTSDSPCIQKCDSTVVNTEKNTERFRNSQTQTAKARENPPFDLERFRNDNEGLHFYTGLETYEKLMYVLSTLGLAAYSLTYYKGYKSALTVHNQFFLTLMKLRRNYTTFELSKMFNISKSAVGNVFVTWVTFMHLQWGEINISPSRELINYYMPEGFKPELKDTRIIVDALECPVQKASNPSGQQATFSSYKNRNTVKTLVGCTPGGLVSLITDTFGGATSDRQLFERSTITQICKSGDCIMSDKGFDVQDILAPYNITLNKPTSMKGKNQLQCTTVLRDRKISSKRVLIERLIGLAKTYKILTQPMCQSEMMLSSQIVFVCFMLCNFRSCIVT